MYICTYMNTPNPPAPYTYRVTSFQVVCDQNRLIMSTVCNQNAVDRAISRYGVAMISRLLKIIRLFCKRAL